MSATIIKILNSGTSGSPSALATGELAYSYLSGTLINGGDRLYIGTGTEINGEAANIEVVGGKYFTDMLDHTKGTLTANSALIVDANGKIDVFNVDNITLNGNTLSSTDTNGNIYLDPDGTGLVQVSSKLYVTGDLEVDGSLDLGSVGIVGDLTVTGTSGLQGQVTAGSINVSDLTSGRVVYVSTGGELVDSDQLKFNGTTLVVGYDSSGPSNRLEVDTATGDLTTIGDVSVGGTLGVTGESTLASATISDLTDNRIVIAGTAGSLEDDANFTFNGTQFNVGQGNFTVAQATGNTGIAGTLGVTGESTLASATVSDLTSGRVVLAGTAGSLEDNGNLTFNGSELGITGTLNVSSTATLASAIVSDLTATRITFAGASGALVDNGNFTFVTGTSTLNLTGQANVDNVRIDGNTISITDTDGDLTLTPNGAGVLIVDSTQYLRIPVGTQAQRPTGEVGAIRYNTTDGRFEGFASGNWTGLGGVIDVDQNTYIIAETSPGANNNDLEFYTDGVKRVNLDENGMVFTDDTIPLQVGNIVVEGNTISTTTGGMLYLDPNPVGSAGTVVIEGNLQVNGTTTTINSTEVTIDDPVFTLGGDTAPTIDDNKDRGIAFQWHDGVDAKVGFFGWDDSVGRFTFIADATDTSTVFSGLASDVEFGNALLDSVTISSGNYTSNGVMYTDTSGDVQFSASSTEGHVLQINSSGVPVFGIIDCGTY